MTDPAPNRIRIDETDLASPEVDAALAAQQSFGVASAAGRLPERKASLLYRPWFALLVAGALGGLAGWGAIEPFFDDGLRFDARVDEVSRTSTDDAAVVTASGLRVLVRPEVTRVTRDGEAVGLDALEVGAHVVVRGQEVEAQGGPLLVAWEIRTASGPAPAEPASMSGIALRHRLMSLIVFPGVAALVGLFLAAADGLLSRAWRRAALCALVGLSSGLGLGFVASVLAQLVYGFGQGWVGSLRGGDHPLVATLAQMISRGLAWAVVGLAMGLGQGIALRSRRLLLNGVLGGVIGALIGGLLFDPIDQLIHGDAIGTGAALSRAVGFVVIGATTGLMIGVVELLARDAWLKMLAGPISGKEFVLYKNPTVIGSSPKADIYLFKDPGVEPTHALIHVLGEGHELEVPRAAPPVFLNGRPVRRSRLVHGDQLRIGKAVLAFGVKGG